MLVFYKDELQNVLDEMFRLSKLKSEKISKSPKVSIKSYKNGFCVFTFVGSSIKLSCALKKIEEISRKSKLIDVSVDLEKIYNIVSFGIIKTYIGIEESHKEENGISIFLFKKLFYDFYYRDWIKTVKNKKLKNKIIWEKQNTIDIKVLSKALSYVTTPMNEEVEEDLLGVFFNLKKGMIICANDVQIKIASIEAKEECDFFVLPNEAKTLVKIAKMFSRNSKNLSSFSLDEKRCWVKFRFLGKDLLWEIQAKLSEHDFANLEKVIKEKNTSITVKSKDLVEALKEIKKTKSIAVLFDVPKGEDKLHLSTVNPKTKMIKRRIPANIKKDFDKRFVLNLDLLMNVFKGVHQKNSNLEFTFDEKNKFGPIRIDLVDEKLFSAVAPINAIWLKDK